MKTTLPTSRSKLPVEVRRVLDVVESTVMEFDRLTLWIDHPSPDIPVPLIQQHCGKLEVLDCYSLKFNSIWQTEIKIFQPSRRALIELQRTLGPRLRTCVRYGEPALDWLVSDYAAAKIIYRFILEHLHVPNIREPLEFKEGTAYFARRTAPDGKKNARNIVVYADRSSDLWSARHLNLPCCHLEYRFQGIGTLAQHGLLTLSDCIGFDHQGFWREHLQLFQRPKRVELGCHLASKNAHVSDTALTNRANRLLDRYRHGDAVVLQNLWRENPVIADLVTRIDSTPFISNVTL